MHARVRVFWLIVAMGAIGSLLASPALAQTSVGIRAGASVDPDQFYFGVHGDTEPLVEQLRFRPNLEIGVGNDTTLVGINLEFVYPLPINDSPWRIYPGIGPALNIVNRKDNTDLEGGLNIVIGLEHQDGFFTELKIGALDSPDIKFGVGYTFGR